MSLNVNRRSFLRGMLSGTAVCVGLPVLDQLLNGNGSAFANGAKLPVRMYAANGFDSTGSAVSAWRVRARMRVLTAPSTWSKNEGSRPSRPITARLKNTRNSPRQRHVSQRSR